MSNFMSVIQECENAKGAGSKKVIQAALSSADKIACNLITAALNPYAVYNVRQYSISQNNESEQRYDNFFHVLARLQSREVTGNAAIDELNQALSLFSAEEAEYVVRVIDKDLKAGFSADTFNKVHPNAPIPCFDVMLAQKCESTEEFEKAINWPAEASAKLDGERTIAIVTSDGVTYYSRSGKIAAHVNGLFDDELMRIHSEYGDFAMDGERYAGDFTTTMNAKKEGNEDAKSKMQFFAFFIMPLNDWKQQKTSITMKKARDTLESILDSSFTKITLPQSVIVHNYEEMMDRCNYVIDELGQEGLIIKDLNSTYKWDRDYAWTKVKRFYDADCTITGFYNGRAKTRLENTLGGITVMGILEDGTQIETNVGSGFSDELRNEIFENQSEWLGRTVVIKYQEVSKSKSKEVASLRFPTYVRCRDDKLVEV
jgi:DNA ligase 1